MGYTTDFTGYFDITPSLKDEHRDYLLAFAESRRMGLDPKLAAEISDPIREAADLPVGKEGEFVTAVEDGWNRPRHPAVIDYNKPPSTQPGLWNHWVPNGDGSILEWDGGEKFYRYVEWLQYVMERFLIPWDYKVEGEVEWQGEDSDDRGKIQLKGEEMTVFQVEIVYTRANRVLLRARR